MRPFDSHWKGVRTAEESQSPCHSLFRQPVNESPTERHRYMRQIGPRPATQCRRAVNSNSPFGRRRPPKLPAVRRNVALGIRVAWNEKADPIETLPRI